MRTNQTKPNQIESKHMAIKSRHMHGLEVKVCRVLGGIGLVQVRGLGLEGNNWYRFRAG